MDVPNDRRGRIKKLNSKIEENGESDLEKIRAKAALDSGLTESKIQEYLEQLEKAGKIEIEDGKVRPA